MSNCAVKACVRCHKRKVKCSGYPDCEGCRQSRLKCQPYYRPKRSDTLHAIDNAQRRIQWLEDELSVRTGQDVRSLTTGSVISSGHFGERTRQGSSTQSRQLAGASGSTLDETSDNDAFHHAPFGDFANRDFSNNIPSSPASHTPEINLLTLNATGDLRYLGPSSGSFFARYVTSLVRSRTSNNNFSCSIHLPHSDTNNMPSSEINRDIIPAHAPLLVEEVELLQTSYEMWIHTLHPMMNLASLRDLISRCSRNQIATPADVEQLRDRRVDMTDMTIFYLVMSLGATSRMNTIKQLRNQSRQRFETMPPTTSSPSYLYSLAMMCFDCVVEKLCSSLVYIQVILLICMYSSYGPVGSNQWQLSGLAMRMASEMGLHCAYRGKQPASPVKDDRARIFWTAYAVETSLAYNLGRPPSINDEHIGTELPCSPDDSLISVHYIRHRQIQSRVMSQVYLRSGRSEGISEADQQNTILRLQSALDDWFDTLGVIHSSNLNCPYPQRYWDRLYHGTAFVLHRASPLCPEPSAASLKECIRFAGLYVEDMVHVLRTSNVPISWMLVQGIIFAGITMLITARRGIRKLYSSDNFGFLLVDLPAWTRKCSVCLALVNERWEEDLVCQLDAQFEALADETIKLIARELTSHQTDIARAGNTSEITGAQPSITQEINSSVLSNNYWEPPGDPIVAGSAVTEELDSLNWGDFNAFHDFLGIDNSQTFWDIFPTDLDL